MPTVVKNAPIALSVRTGKKTKDKFNELQVDLSVLQFKGIIFDEKSKLMQDVKGAVENLVEGFSERLLKLANFGIDENQITEAIEETKNLMVKSFFSQSAQSNAHKSLLVDTGIVPKEAFEVDGLTSSNEDEDLIDLSDM
jgi:hypothetical protein